MNRFLEEDGQGMVEYALIVALIAVACIAVFVAIGNKVNDKATQVKNGLDGKAPTTTTGGTSPSPKPEG